KIKAKADFLPQIRIITLTQTVHYTNVSADTLHRFYFNDWANAFKSKVSPLGQHFSSEYIKRFHFSTLTERGETHVDYIKNSVDEYYQWYRPKKHPDIIALTLKKPLAPGDSAEFHLHYTIRVPLDK